MPIPPVRFALLSVAIIPTALFAQAPAAATSHSPAAHASAATAPASAVSAGPTAEQLKTWIPIRQQRVDLLRDEIKQIDQRLETRLDVIIDTLKSMGDSMDSRTRVTRMKEDTGKRLMTSIKYYDQKRASIKEELRSPRLHLTPDEKRKIIAIFDERINKRTRQIFALYESMPQHQDHERYRTSGDAWYGSTYERNPDYDQNRRMTSHSNAQRKAVEKQIADSIARLERYNRTLKTQLDATSDPLQRKTLSEEYAKNDALIAERRYQRVEMINPSGTATRSVALKEAVDMDHAMQRAVTELRTEFTTLFQRYNTYLQELSALHATEALLSAKGGH